MGSTKLSLYNGALRLLYERKLASLTEDREPRRLLDDAWGDGSTTGAVRYCLEMSQWAFATRAVLLDYSPSVTPSFGHPYAFDHPSDFVRTVALCQDEFFREPLLEYVDERNYWYASIPSIYIKYVSNHSTYGADLSLWPESFAKTVEARLAFEIAWDDAKKKLADTVWDREEKKAKSLDAMAKPTTFPPEGSWSRSRRGWGSRSRWSERWT